MIPLAYIKEWRAFTPWVSDAQVEQDFIISRALIDIFKHPFLQESLAFRGGTALHKLFIRPAARYSEDIDLVQVREGPIGPIMEALRKQLTPWLGTPKWKLNEGRATFVFRFETEGAPITPLRLKIEINTREHFNALGLQQLPFQVETSWLSERVMITTYILEELLGTKLRALYQRKKGRDLFDLAIALRHFPNLNLAKLLECFHRYMEFEAKKVSRAEFEGNLIGKMNDVIFLEDIRPLLPSRSTLSYDPVEELKKVQSTVINLLPGEPWKGG